MPSLEDNEMWIDALRGYLKSESWTKELAAFQDEREWVPLKSKDSALRTPRHLLN